MKLYECAKFYEEIKPHTLKNLIENLFASLGEKVTIYPNKTGAIYPKTTFNGSVVYAYKSKNSNKTVYAETDNLLTLIKALEGESGKNEKSKEYLIKAKLLKIATFMQ